MTNRLEASTVIERPIDEVFEFVSNFENRPKWELGYSQVTKITNGPIGVGTEFAYVFPQTRSQSEGILKIFEFEPQRLVGYAIPEDIEKSRHQYIFEEVDCGTKVTFVNLNEYKGCAKFMTRASGRGLQEYANDLKQYMEQEKTAS